jgi:hypothetical protein
MVLENGVKLCLDFSFVYKVLRDGEQERACGEGRQYA